MLQQLGPGRYDVKVLNRRALHVTGRRVTVGGPQAAAPTGPQAPPPTPQQSGGPWGGPVQATPQAHPYAPPVQPPNGFAAAMLGGVPAQVPPPIDPYAQGPQPMGMGGLQDQMMAAMIQRMINPPADPMRDALASMMKMMALGMQNSQQTMQQMATLQATTQPPAGAGAAELLAPMVTSLIGELSRARETGGAGGDAQSAIAMLQMGLQLREQINGDGDSREWLKVVPQLADSMGPGVVAAIATAMIKDPAKSQAVLDTINEHMRTRSAEATGEIDDAPIGTPPGSVLDTPGAAVA